mgnify:CR=1 FL=1
MVRSRSTPRVLVDRIPRAVPNVIGVVVNDLRKDSMPGYYADYFAELAARSADREFFLGTPIDFVQGQCRDTYIQLLNAGLPGGLIDAQSTAEQMNEACYTGG